MATNDLLLSTFPLFILGTAVGSFLNVVSRRLLRGKKIKGRSQCESCGKTLKWRDLVPLLSFIMLRGRCRYCNKKLSWQYPIVELGTGFLFALLGVGHGLLVWNALPISPLVSVACCLSFIALLAASSALIVVLITDLKKQLIFDRVLLIGVICALVYRALLPTLTDQQLVTVLYDVFLALLAFSFFWFLRFITKGKGMGEGDAPLAFLVSLLSGFPLGLITLWLAFVSGAAVGLGLVLTHQKRLKSQIAFAPFLVIATFASMLFGDRILDWYLGFLGL